MHAPRTLTFALVAALVALPRLAAQDPEPQEPKPGAGKQDPTKLIPLPNDREAEQKGFPIRELTIEEALTLGRRNNVELRAAELLPEQARQAMIGAEAFFEPELFAELGYSDSQSPARSTFQPSTQRDTIDAALGWRQRLITGGAFDLAYRPNRVRQSVNSTFSFPSEQFTSEITASITQPLLRGAWTDYGLRNVVIARHNFAASRHDFARTVQDTLLRVVEAYWELTFARENYRVVFQALEVAQEQLRITEERIRARDLAQRDRVADEAEVARRQEELIIAENLIRNTEDSLRRLLIDDQRGGLWRYNVRPISPMEPDPEVDETPFERYADVALANRPDLKALLNDVSAAEVELMAAQRDLLPGLDLIGSYSSDGVRNAFPQAWSDSIDQDFPDWSVRLELSLPIGNRAARAERQRASLELERRRRVYYGAMMDVTREVREAGRGLRTLAQSIQASGESVRLAETNLETEQIKLGVGSTTVFEVQRRNQELREARSRHLRNQLDYRIAQSRLLYVQGILEVPE